MRRRKSSLNPFKVILILVLIFMLMDAGLRRLIPAPPPEMNLNRPADYHALFVPDQFGQMLPKLDTRVEQNGFRFDVKTNSQGMRSPEYQRQKPKGTIRIAVLGDSASFGWLMEEAESYPALLRERFNRDTAQSYEVINFSQPGMSTVQGEFLFHSTVSQVQADVLILSFGLYDAKNSFLSDRFYLEILGKYGFTSSQHEWRTLLSRFSTLGHWWLHRVRAPLYDAVTPPPSTMAQMSVARVKPQEAFRALNNIISRFQADGGRAIFVDSNIHHHYLYDTTHTLQQEHGITLLSVHSMLQSSGGVESRKIRYQKELAYPEKKTHDREDLSILFRVYAQNAVGMHVRIQNLQTKQSEWHEMNDQGSGGDETAQDGVWSVRVYQDRLTLGLYAFAEHPSHDSEEDSLTPLLSDPHARLLKIDEPSNGYEIILPLAVYQRLPHAGFRLKEHPEYPGRKLHVSLANRLHYSITHR